MVNQGAILWPMMVLVGWTMMVLLLMPYEIFKATSADLRQLENLKFGLGGSAGVPEGLTTVNRHFMNLLEIPILFYVLCLTLYVTQQVDALAIQLAWGFVGLRLLHSLIHLSYNKVLHRAAAYATSNLVLATLWAITLLDLAR